MIPEHSEHLRVLQQMVLIQLNVCKNSTSTALPPPLPTTTVVGYTTGTLIPVYYHPTLLLSACVSERSK